VLVKIHYVAINYAKMLSRGGLYGWAGNCPNIPGMEGSGFIDEAGKGVSHDRVGQKVMVGTKYGTYSEKIIVYLPSLFKHFPNRLGILFVS
jgi:NADPH:quinone reductase-like Zn-dependent oxidoreductase